MATTTDRRAPGDAATRLVAWGLLAVTVVAFLVVSWGRITGPFGDSDEGINGAVWAYASRSMRDLGPVESALGGRHLNGSRYATHPPLIVSETALAETIAGEHGASSRAAAWVGSIVALFLLYRLGRRLGFSPVSAAGGAAVAGTTGMFVTYGPMLDTPVTAFPFAVGVTLLWTRDWQGDDPPSPWLTATVTLAACLASWQCALLAGLAGAALAVRHRRDPGRALLAAAPYLGGATAGVALSIGWSWWTYGDLGALSDKLGRRTGSSSTVGLADVVSFQVPWLAELLGLGTLGLVGSVVALWDRPVRPAAALTLATALGYALLFREAAAGHQYWCYWVLLPVAIGSGWGLSRLERDVRARRGGTVAPVVGVVVAVVLVGAFDLARPGKAAGWISGGHQAVELLRTGVPAEQRVIHYVGEKDRPDPMVVYELGRTAEALTTAADLDALAAQRPDEPVYVVGVCGDGDAGVELCRRVTTLVEGAPTGEGPPPPRLVPAAELAERLRTGG